MLRTILPSIMASALMVGSIFLVVTLFSECFGDDGARPVVTGNAPTATPSQISEPVPPSPTSGIVALLPTTTASPAVTATMATPTAGTPSPTPPASTPTQEAIRPTSTPVPVAPAIGNFAGNWRITDVVQDGTGTGQTYTFDVTFTQSGNALQGGNGAFRIQGVVDGLTATGSYVQQDIGVTGTFVWTLSGSGRAAGSFTSSIPNSGSSQLTRR